MNEKEQPTDNLGIENVLKIQENKPSVKTIGSKSLEEEKEEERNSKLESAVESKVKEMVKKQFKLQFLQVVEKINKGMTLDDIIEEVNQKKSNMTKSARDFVVNFKPEVITEWIEEYNKENKKD